MFYKTLVIFQKNLKKNTLVKIINRLNNRYLIATVGKKTNYPSFNNSVLSIRIAKELAINIEEPYVHIIEISKGSSFVAKKAKIYEEEKEVANKMPVDDISINDLNKKKKRLKKNPIKNFLT